MPPRRRKRKEPNQNGEANDDDGRKDRHDPDEHFSSVDHLNNQIGDAEEMKIKWNIWSREKRKREIFSF